MQLPRTTLISGNLVLRPMPRIGWRGPGPAPPLAQVLGQVGTGYMQAAEVSHRLVPTGDVEQERCDAEFPIYGSGSGCRS
jgi:hypothetical protein